MGRAGCLFSMVMGFVLMWPLGEFCGNMGWSACNFYSLSHGAFIVAWPILAFACHAFLPRPKKPPR